MDNQNNKDRQRLENLIAGNTRGYRLSDSELAPFFKNSKNISLIILAVVLVLLLGYYAYLDLSNPPAYTYNFNPVSKIILIAKSTDFIEENYADFEENMEIDINTGIVKNKNGYTVTCEDKNNTDSNVVIYFSRSFEILNHHSHIRPDRW